MNTLMFLFFISTNTLQASDSTMFARCSTWAAISQDKQGQSMYFRAYLKIKGLRKPDIAFYYHIGWAEGFSTGHGALPKSAKDDYNSMCIGDLKEYATELNKLKA